MTNNTDPVRAVIGEITDYLDQEIDPELDVIERWRDRLESALVSAPLSVPVGVECDPAAIGAAFLAVLGDPSVSWRTMPDVDRFTSRVAEAAAPQQPAAPSGEAALHASIVKEAAEVLQMVADSGVTLPPNWRWPLLDELSGIAYRLAAHRKGGES